MAIGEKHHFQVLKFHIAMDRILSYRISMKPLVVIGFLGSTLDASKFGPSRWGKWRPSVALTMHEDLRVDRFVLLHGAQHGRLALRGEIATKAAADIDRAQRRSRDIRQQQRGPLPGDTARTI